MDKRTDSRGGAISLHPNQQHLLKDECRQLVLSDWSTYLCTIDWLQGAEAPCLDWKQPIVIRCSLAPTSHLWGLMG